MSDWHWSLNIKKLDAALQRAAHKAMHGTPEERSGRFTMATPPAAPAKLGKFLPAPAAAPASAPAVETYAGDNICVSFDGRMLWLRTAVGNFPMSLATLAAINQYAAFAAGKDASLATSLEANVYCEDTKKHHRALLLRELTLDEIYKGLK